jgi:hypothetical protein
MALLVLPHFLPDLFGEVVKLFIGHADGRDRLGEGRADLREGACLGDLFPYSLEDKRLKVLTASGSLLTHGRYQFRWKINGQCHPILRFWKRLIVANYTSFWPCLREFHDTAGYHSVAGQGQFYRKPRRPCGWPGGP